MDTNSGATVATPCQQVQVEPVQEDIPGAALDEPLDVQNVAALRWWLQCHGIKPASSWRKCQESRSDRYNWTFGVLEISRLHGSLLY